MRRFRGGGSTLLAIALLARVATGGDPPPAAAAGAWRDAKQLESIFAVASDAVEAACGAKFSKRPSFRPSTVDDVMPWLERESLASFGFTGGRRPIVMGMARPRWLVRRDPESNVVHLLPEQADEAAADPTRAVLATEAGLRILLVGALVEALAAERFGPDVPGTAETFDAQSARVVVREAHRQSVIAGVAAAWGLTKELGEIRRALFGRDSTFASAAGVAFLDAVRSERGTTGLEDVLRDPPPSTRFIQRPELWLHPERSASEVDLGALLLPIREILRDPLWRIDAARPSDDAFERWMRRSLGHDAKWTLPGSSLDARHLEANDGPLLDSARIEAWVVLYPDEAAARRFVDSWGAARAERPESAMTITKGAGLGSKLHGLTIEKDWSAGAHATLEVGAVGSVAFAITSHGAPEIDRSALDAALERMAAFLDDPVRARAQWESSPAPFIAHSRTVELEVRGPDGELVPRVTAHVHLVHGRGQTIEVRGGKGRVQLSVGVRALVWLREARSEDGTPLPIAPIEQVELAPDATVLRVSLKTGKFLHGQVIDFDERPIQGVVVVAVGDGMLGDSPLAELDGMYGIASSGPDGHFRIIGVGDGPYRLLVYEGAAEKAIAREEYASPQYTSDIQIPRGKGRTLTVVDPTGLPVVGARVIVRDGDRLPNAEFATPVDGRTDAEGRIRTFLPPRDFFTLEIRPPEDSDLTEPAPNRIWQSKDSLVVLVRGVTIEGVLVDASGEPTRGTVFRSLPWGFARASAADDGKFRFRGVAAGPISLLGVTTVGAELPPAGATPAGWTGIRDRDEPGRAIVLRAWSAARGAPPTGTPK